MWFLKHYIFNLIELSLLIGFVWFLVWLGNIGFWYISLTICILILVAIFTLWQGPSIDDFKFKDSDEV